MAIIFKEIRTRTSPVIPYGDPDPELYQRYLDNKIKWASIESRFVSIELSDDSLIETITYRFDSVEEFREVMEDRAYDPFLIQFLGRQKEYRKRNDIIKETILLDEENNVIEYHKE